LTVVKQGPKSSSAIVKLIGSLRVGDKQLLATGSLGSACKQLLVADSLDFVAVLLLMDVRLPLLF
jgi:hypothetical protein